MTMKRVGIGVGVVVVVLVAGVLALRQSSLARVKNASTTASGAFKDDGCSSGTA